MCPANYSSHVVAVRLPPLLMLSRHAERRRFIDANRRTCSMHKTKENPRNPYPFPAPACSDLFRQDGRSCINEEAKRPGVVVAALHAVRAPCTELLLGREVRSEIDGACRCSRRAARAADPGRLRGGGGAHLQCNPRSVPAAS